MMRNVPNKWPQIQETRERERERERVFRGSGHLYLRNSYVSLKRPVPVMISCQVVPLYIAARNITHHNMIELANKAI